MAHFDPNKTYYAYGPASKWQRGDGFRWVGRYTPDKKYTVFERDDSKSDIREREVVVGDQVHIYDDWYRDTLNGRVSDGRVTTCRKKAFNFLEYGEVSHGT